MPCADDDQQEEELLLSFGMGQDDEIGLLRDVEVKHEQQPRGKLSRGRCTTVFVSFAVLGGVAMAVFSHIRPSAIRGGNAANSMDTQLFGGQSSVASDLYNSVLVKADLWRGYPAILSAGVGFSGYMGLPDTDKDTILQNGIQYNDEGSGTCYNRRDTPPTSNAAAKTAPWEMIGFGESCDATSTSLEPGMPGDGTPVCFSWPIIGYPQAKDFEFTITNWKWKTIRVATPSCAGLNPNFELNERHCVVIFADLADKSTSGGDGYLASFLKIKSSDEFSGKWQLVGPDGPVSPAGLTLATNATAYKTCSGPFFVGAKLNIFSADGEGTGSYAGIANAWAGAANENSGLHLYGDAAQYRIRLFYTGGMTPNGINGLTPDSFERLWTLILNDGTQLNKVGKSYQTSQGSLKIVGLADLGEARSTCEAYADVCYAEDADNYIDIILEADSDEVAGLVKFVDVKSGLFNPGGPGLTPRDEFKWTVANSPQLVPVMNDLAGTMQVTYCNGVTYKDGGTKEQVDTCSDAGGVPRRANDPPSKRTRLALYCKPGQSNAWDNVKSRLSSSCPKLCYTYETPDGKRDQKLTCDQ